MYNLLAITIWSNKEIKPMGCPQDNWQQTLKQIDFFSSSELMFIFSFTFTKGLQHPHQTSLETKCDRYV